MLCRKDGQSLHLGDVDSDEKRGDRTAPAEGDDPRDVIVDVAPSTGFL